MTRRIGLLSARLGRANGGVWEAVVAQVAIVRALGAEPVVAGVGELPAAERDRLGAAEMIALPPWGPPRLGFAPAMAARLRAAGLDLLHLHGLWSGATHAAAGWARATGRPLVVSPHGMLDPWITARGRAVKRAARLLWEDRGRRAATLFHALTAAEAAAIHATLGPVAVAVAPNAVAALPRLPGPRAPTVLYLGRLHPKKNLRALVAGWALAADALPPGARLVIAGWGEPAHVRAVEAAVAAAGRADIHLAGPLWGADKAAALGAARFMALPSESEGLPMALLEAWAAATPTLHSAACHLPEGLAAGAALDCGTGAEAVAAALRAAFALDHAGWRAMSDAAAALADGPFSPARVGARWAELYRGSSAAPAMAA